MTRRVLVKETIFSSGYQTTRFNVSMTRTVKEKFETWATYGTCSKDNTKPIHVISEKKESKDIYAKIHATEKAICLWKKRSKDWTKILWYLMEIPNRLTLNHTLLTLTKESVSLTASCSLSSLHGRRQKGKEKPRVGIWFFPFAGYSLSDITRHGAPLPGLIHDKITTGEFK